VLLGGTAALVLVIISRVASRDHAAAAGPAGHASLTIPEGASITGVTGVGDRLALHLVSSSGESILLVNPSSGAIVATLEIKR
jgi:uncharacterized ion transporter superfamily protein YfcC